MLFLHNCYLILLVVCYCTLLQASPIMKNVITSDTDRSNQQTFPNHLVKRSSDNECVSEDDRTVPVGETVTRLVINNYSSLITSLDLCFVISGVNTMPSSDRWVQHLAADIDQQLKAAGIGAQSGHENRFCVVHYGIKNEPNQAKFIKVNNRVFFGSDEISKTRAILKSNGFYGDGYKALEYTINNAPFRADQHVAKSLILFSDGGRSILADNTGLTKPFLLSVLDNSNITLDIVTNLTTPYSNNTLGFLDYHTIVSSDDNGHVQVNGSNDHVVITGSHGNALSSYAELAFQTGGGAWLMDFMYSKGGKVYRDRVTQLAKGYIESRRFLSDNICQVCTCGEGRALSCSTPRNQQLCLTCKSQANCKSSTSAGLPLAISSVVSQTVNDTVNITFHSNREDVMYECTLLDSVNVTTEYCVSPVVLTGLSAGEYKFLIVGSTQDKLSVSSEIVQFNITPKGNSILSIEVTDKTISNDGQSISVSFNAVSPYINNHVTVMCKIGDGQFTLCKSPFIVQRSSIIKGWVESLTFIATDDFGGFALKQENIHFTGENAVRLEKGDINSDGVVSVFLYGSNTPAYCICSYIETRKNFQCTPPSDGQPFVMTVSSTANGATTNNQQTILASCSYLPNNGGPNTVSDNIIINLEQPTSLQNEALSCSLRINGPYTNSTITADFQCNNEITTTLCTIDSRPSQNCFSGESFDLQSLLPGYHIFTLTAVSPLSGSKHTRIQPFFVSTSVNYECQPLILVDDSTLVTNGKTATLSLSTSTGTCTDRDEFSYEISWEDGSKYDGVTAGHVTPLSFSQTYSFSGHYTAKVDFCSNSCRNLTRCCSSVDLPLQIN